uniref:Uncharacterized protein n=1 Tax=Gadus morhua TaxID=8049 RepID=A0A8C5ASI0_GADMO
HAAYIKCLLKTFMGWPFEEGCACTPEKVSNIKLTHYHLLTRSRRSVASDHRHNSEMIQHTR